ncbi:MAG: FliH/SctL family protein [Candidatus Brocadiia bacterium]
MRQVPSILPSTVLAGGPVVVANGGGLEARGPREKEIERRAYQRGRAEGYEAGRGEGVAEGRQAARKELEAARQALAAATAELGEARRRFLAEAGDGVLELALAVARKIVCGEAAATRQVAQRVVAEAIRQAQDAAVLRVRLHPRDKEAIDQAGGGPPGIELAADPAIQPGGCVAETDCGAIDATIDSQWEAVAAALREAADDHHADGEPQPPAPPGADHGEH